MEGNILFIFGKKTIYPISYFEVFQTLYCHIIKLGNRILFKYFQKTKRIFELN